MGVAGGKTTVSLDPLLKDVSAEDTFNVSVFCVPEQSIKGFEFKLSFDSSILKANSVTEGDIFDGYFSIFNAGTIDNNEGKIVDVYGFIVGPGDVSENGTFVNVSFTVKDISGSSKLDIYDIGVTDEVGYIPIDVSDGSVSVQRTVSNPPTNNNPPAPPTNTSENDTVQNNPPDEPVKPSAPTFVEIGVEYEFQSSTVDIDGDQIKYRFDWDNNNYSNWSGFVPSNASVKMPHSWDSKATYSVRIIAQDENGLNSSWSIPLNVTVSEFDSDGKPPVADFGLHNKISTNQTIFFDASGSFDVDGVITSYLWDFDDGNTGSGVSPTYIYETPGKYTVTLVVTDDEGNRYSKSMVVTVVATGEEEQSGEDQGLLFDLGMILIGFTIALVVFLVVFFRDNIKSFVSSHIPNINLYSYFKIWDMDSRIKRMDAKIEQIENIRARRIDLQQSPILKANNSSYEIAEESDQARRKIDFMYGSNAKEKKSFDEVDKAFTKDNIDQLVDRKVGHEKPHTEMTDDKMLKDSKLRSTIDSFPSSDSSKKPNELDVEIESVISDTSKKDIEKNVDDFLTSKIRDKIDDL